jgi:uncharacterized protein
MTPDERQMITGLFGRMRQQGGGEKDRDAEALIRDTVRQMPDAPYMMVQTVLVQEMALQNSQQQIDDLQDRVRSLESQASKPQSSGSFLGGLFGGGSKPSAVPSIGSSGNQSAGFGGAPASGARSGSPWGNTSQAAAPGGYQQPAYQGGQMGGQQGGMAPMQQQPAGGGFMRSAMTTAAGVAGGMLAANAISNMMNGGSSAHASPAAAAAKADGNDAGGSYAAPKQDEGNDAGGSYDAPQEDGNDAGGSYDDGGGYSED